MTEIYKPLKQPHNEKEKKRLESYEKNISKISNEIDNFFKGSSLETIPFDESSTDSNIMRNNTDLISTNDTSTNLCKSTISGTSSSVPDFPLKTKISFMTNNMTRDKRSFMFSEMECQNINCCSTRSLVICHNITTEKIVLCKDCLTSLSKDIISYLNL